MMEEVFDPAATADYRQQARQFLAKSREYLAVGDLHQALGKGMGSGRLDSQSSCNGARLGIQQT